MDSGYIYITYKKGTKIFQFVRATYLTGRRCAAVRRNYFKGNGTACLALQQRKITREWECKRDKERKEGAANLPAFVAIDPPTDVAPAAH